MTAKKAISKTGPSKNDGKAKQILKPDPAKPKKNAVKYTLWRTKEDIKNFEKLRSHLKNQDHNSTWNTDSEIYKKLPGLYQNAVKVTADQDLVIAELTAKVERLEQLQDHICRIFELCKMKGHD